MKLAKLVVFSLFTSVFVACSNNEGYEYDGNAAEVAAKKIYGENFVSKYPNVTLNQNWDYSNVPEFGLPVSNGAPAFDITRGSGDVMTNTTEYEVDMEVVKWMKDNLPNGADNRSKGKPFFMHVPSNSFSIVPIYQGGANGIWDLHMVVNGVDYLVWSKSKDLYIKDASHADWTAISSLNVSRELDRNTTKATAVKAPMFTFTNMPTGSDIYFYVEITYTTSNVHRVGDKLSSISGNMITLSCPRPANIDEDKQVAIIACEDGVRNNVDWDMEDVVFMVVGNPDIPETITLTNGTPIVKRHVVRYLFEDLGATDDFDFNDIVVDVEEESESTPIISTMKDKSGKNIEWLTGWNDGEKTQKATVRHLGGELPFKLTIGDTEIADIQPHLNSNPDKEYEVTGWNSTTHNVMLSVGQSSSNGTYFNTVKFPKAGEAPMVIAVSPALPWMAERQSIPEEWFTEN